MIDIQTIPNEIHSIPLEDSYNILLNWYERYQKLAKQLYLDNAKVRCDLSGGRDSRISFSLFAQNYCPISAINANQKKTEYTLWENNFSSDLITAKKVAEYYNKAHLVNVKLDGAIDKVTPIGLHPDMIFT